MKCTFVLFICINLIAARFDFVYTSFGVTHMVLDVDVQDVQKMEYMSR
jgi:hypothetical protein